MESVGSTMMLGDWRAQPHEGRSHVFPLPQIPKAVPFLLLWAGQVHSWPIAAPLWPHAVYSQVCKLQNLVCRVLQELGVGARDYRRVTC